VLVASHPTTHVVTTTPEASQGVNPAHATSQRPGALPKGAAVTYLIVGLDRNTHARWHQNVMAGDIATATLIARARAAAQGIHLLVAAVIGPNSSVESDPTEEGAAASKAA
jgi:hypothetical protein